MARRLESARGSMPLSELLERKEKLAMASFGVRDLDTMMRFAPRRYTVPAPLRSLHDTHEGEEVSAIVTVERVSSRSMRSRHGSILEVVVTDGIENITLTFFLAKQHLVDWHTKRLAVGRRVLVRGTVGRNKMTGNPQITHPDYEEFEDSEEGLAHAQRPRPVYPLRKNIAQRTMRAATEKGLEFAEYLARPVPARIVEARGLLPLPEAVAAVHTPRTEQDTLSGVAHLVYEEAFVLQAIFAQRRTLDERSPAPALRAEGPLQTAFDERLPFELTAGQKEIGEEIIERVGRDHPTSMLLQGDVGSGKTVIALRAMLRAVDSGHQAALLAPTEVLAEQHHRTILGLLGDLARAGQLDGHLDATRVRLLTGSQKTSARRETLLDVTSGQAGIVVGTHALLTESVEFASLGLVVIDEQHRFGVDHRRRLRSKGPGGMTPHVVVMTATPIPRTAALATVGDLDVLTLRESPGMRAGVESFVVPEQLPKWENRMWARAAEEIAAQRQVFVVCARIDETDDSPPPATILDENGEISETRLEEARGVTATAERLATRPELAGARIGVLHGRLTSEQKQQTMDRVVAGEIDLLVATTVIEVGVDVPNASVMIVLDAERFGVSQLHQLRGRVGRGEHPGIAFLDTRTTPEHPAFARLEGIAGAADGFALADLDLQVRGAGDLVGEEQSGLQRTLKHLDVIRDAPIIDQARQDAFAVLAADPDLTDHPDLAGAIANRLRDADPDVERS
ncbi:MULTISPECIES: ATP-dependent DNA helicase RecG [Brachybacterium]|uniref:Probable DNA 3'-5' helicase RecG n=1 Tax=Brachybacterium alimentarium TaxID=47845 RepID=A0A2A3YIA5_9MICO|nr:MULTISPECIES: ATP-dependent DNA helicase RecG [Brachybacterium]PCC32780.1 ATP-dependent DNA helicase RecG [Brachybacterium alimentarium]PCC38959.1 ATP-dependent DNA helicase RecG [Brachybacterium alimentarium]RCS63959.1 ATP-dependent DNA helicase RecG [Brachybacterium sp. JB7]RCS77533.1 ATP-dependent DNA helicase RecG [Brachybacterium alimentarium]RCS78313.1 ATP-dependent DNA helicase RecG [Brachybacterium alimentarium]